MASVDRRTGQSRAPLNTVRCASHVAQPLGSDSWSSDKWGHRTGLVHCLVRLLAPALTSTRAGAHCLLLLFLADDRWREVAVAPLAHQTVRCYTGQFGEFYQSGFPKFLKLASSESISLVHRTFWCARPGLPSVYFAHLF
jgi:hypothetical protein